MPFTYSNNLEKIETIRDDGLIEGADPTIAALTGRIDVLAALGMSYRLYGSEWGRRFSGTPGEAPGTHPDLARSGLHLFLSNLRSKVSADVCVKCFTDPGIPHLYHGFGGPRRRVEPASTAAASVRGGHHHPGWPGLFQNWRLAFRSFV
jgi:hypothetical protein